MKKTALIISLLCFSSFDAFSNSIKKPVSQTKQKSSILSVNLNSIQILSSSKQPVLLEIHADWCGPCKRMLPIFENISFSFSKKVKCAKLLMNSFSDSDPVIQFLKKEYNITIQCVPTFLLLKKGKVVATFEGSMNFQVFSNKLTEALKK